MSMPVFSLTCFGCDDGMYIATEAQAKKEGWIGVEDITEENWPEANYAGWCADCKLSEDCPNDVRATAGILLFSND